MCATEIRIEPHPYFLENSRAPVKYQVFNSPKLFTSYLGTNTQGSTLNSRNKRSHF